VCSDLTRPISMGGAEEPLDIRPSGLRAVANFDLGGLV